MFKKQTDPSVKILVIGTFLFVLATSAYFITTKVTNTKNETSEKLEMPSYFDFGSVTDSIYCNDFFGFKIPIPSGHQADYKKYDLAAYDEDDAVVRSILDRDTVPIRPKRLEEVDTQVLLLITPELIKVAMNTSFENTGNITEWMNYEREKSRRETWGPDFQLFISVKNLSGTTLNTYINLFENIHDPGYAEPKTTLIGGKLFREYEGKESYGSVQQSFSQILGGKNRDITSYFTQINGFALCIDLFYETEAQKEILDAMVESITFHEPLKNTTP